MFVARPPATSARGRDLHLVRAVRRTFTGPAEFLADPGNRARVGEYLADMARPFAREVPAALFGEPPSPALGHSYGEMAEALIGPLVSADEPIDLLILAFSVHDLRPGRQTAAYLSDITPGAPMAFAICDQGSAAAFSGLRAAREYASSAGIRRALLIVVEQAALPYRCPVSLPSQHRGIAMLYGHSVSPGEHSADPGASPRTPWPGTPRGDDGAWAASGQAPSRVSPGERPPKGDEPWARVVDVRQHPGVPPGDVPRLAAADLTAWAAGSDEVALVLSSALAGVWDGPALLVPPPRSAPAPIAGRVRVMPPGQPSTDVWWGLVDEFTGDARPAALVVAADYDPGLRYLCLTAFDTGSRAS